MTDTRTIDTHIKNLRRKVEAPSAYTYIVTVRGVGYRFRVQPKSRETGAGPPFPYRGSSGCGDGSPDWLRSTWCSATAWGPHGRRLFWSVPASFWRRWPHLRWLASWIKQSLELLARDLALIARGHSDRVTASGPRETVKLSEAINGMAEDLAGVIDELRSETALREQILASMREGVVLADGYGEVIYANQAAHDMFGRSPRDLLPAQLEEPGEHELTIHHPRRRELRSTSVRLPDGRTLVVIQDETERKRVESIRRDFVANASHELKTPVAGIMVTAETVERAIDEDLTHARRFAANLVREARRLSALVQDLLDLARLERGQGERTRCGWWR